MGESLASAEDAGDHGRMSKMVGAVVGTDAEWVLIIGLKGVQLSGGREF